MTTRTELLRVVAVRGPTTSKYASPVTRSHAVHAVHHMTLDALMIRQLNVSKGPEAASHEAELDDNLVNGLEGSRYLPADSSRLRVKKQRTMMRRIRARSNGPQVCSIIIGEYTRWSTASRTSLAKGPRRCGRRLGYRSTSPRQRSQCACILYRI